MECHSGGCCRAAIVSEQWWCRQALVAVSVDDAGLEVSFVLLRCSKRYLIKCR